MEHRGEESLSEIFSTITLGLSSSSISSQFSTVQFCLSAIDNLLVREDPTFDSSIQKVVNILELCAREHSSTNKTKEEWPYEIRGEVIGGLGKRISIDPDVNVRKFRGNSRGGHYLLHPLYLCGSVEVEVDLNLSCFNMERMHTECICLSGSNFYLSKLSYSSFHDCEMRYCNFGGAVCDSLVLDGDASFSSFEGSNLDGCHLSGTFKEVDFTGSHMTMGILSLSETSGCRFNDCDLRWANLQDSEASIDLSGAQVNCDTVFPGGHTVSSIGIKEVQRMWGNVTLCSS